MINHKLHHGDNLATLKTYPDNHFDSVITDPPYGIDFLGKSWDSHTGTQELYAECLRVLKPGGYLLAFSAARTYHHLAMSVELAGFEIKDQIMWIYSSGFPKAIDLGKAIEKRKTLKSTAAMSVGKWKNSDGGNGTTTTTCHTCNRNNVQIGCTFSCDINGCEMKEKLKPADNEWAGWKTALKPAHEPIVMGRKPMKQSCIDNIQEHGVGALNIDATRIEFENGIADYDIRTYQQNQNNISRNTEITDINYGKFDISIPTVGRYPSNVVGEVAEDYQKYFYCPKVSRKERHVGFDMPKALTGNIKGCYDEKGNRLAKTMDSADGFRGNNHPTVKPQALMEYLIKLVTPASTPELQRKVLDPFMGSGSTGMAAVKLGHHFTGCDLDESYINIADTRIIAWNAPEPITPQEAHLKNLFEDDDD